jgi:hypothetical protein
MCDQRAASQTSLGRAKFGGTSVSSAGNWRNIADVVRRAARIAAAGNRAFRIVRHHRSPRILVGCALVGTHAGFSSKSKPGTAICKQSRDRAKRAV